MGMKRNAIGIDPGVSGGLVLGTIGPDGTRVVMAEPMPQDFDGIHKLLSGWIRHRCVEVVFIEDVPKFCGTNLSASTMSVLFRNVGFLEGVIYSHLGLPPTRLAPLKWMNLVSQDHTRSRIRPERKAQLKDLARRMFPDTKWTDKTCDAALILEAGRRTLYAKSAA